MRRAGVALAAALVTLAGCDAPVPVVTDPAAPPAAEPPPLAGYGAALAPGPVRIANADLAAAFVALSFFREDGRELPHLLRFETPIRVRMQGFARHAGDLSRLLARLRREAGIDIAIAPPSESENLRIEPAPAAALTRIFPAARCVVVPGLVTWPDYRARLEAGGRPDRKTADRIAAATIFIRDSATPQQVRNCLDEELAQALGPGNDLYRLPESVFNDDNVHERLTRFDLLMLRVLYDERLHSGMDRATAQEAARAVLDEINPAGRRIARRPGQRPAPQWHAIVAGVFEARPGAQDRRAALTRALRIAEGFPQPDPRLAITLDFLATAEFDRDPRRAEALMERAVDSLARNFPPGDLRLAVFRVYLAQIRLGLGRHESALALVDAALPALIAHAAATRIDQALRIR
ncbi:MAG: DUF2927 domain-containing protein, partial [Alphaproteobacteria bacterium]